MYCIILHCIAYSVRESKSPAVAKNIKIRSKGVLPVFFFKFCIWLSQLLSQKVENNSIDFWASAQKNIKCWTVKTIDRGVRLMQIMCVYIGGAQSCIVPSDFAVFQCHAIQNRSKKKSKLVSRLHNFWLLYCRITSGFLQYCYGLAAYCPLHGLRFDLREKKKNPYFSRRSF